MADVKLQLGIRFLDKDIEVGAITKQVQRAINRAIAQVDLSSLKAKMAELQKMGTAATAGATKAAKTVQDQAQAYNVAAKTADKAATSTSKFADAKKEAAGISVVNEREVRLLTAAEARTRELENAFSKAGVTAAGFGARIGEIAKRFSGFFVYTIALFKFLEALRFTAEQMELLNRTSADLAKVLKDNTTREIEAAKDTLIGLAISTRRSFQEVATAAQGFVRQGLNLQDSIEATRATMELLNVSLIDAATAQKLVTVLMQSMGLSADDAAQKINVFSVVADSSASTVEDLAAGFSRAGSTARAFGISTEELAAAVGTVVAVTQLSATRVGTAFKTILSYTASNRAALLDLAAGYQGINKSTAELASEHQDVIDVLRFVAQGWDDMDSAQKTAIGRLVGGKRRFNELAALMGNMYKFEELLQKGMSESDAVRRKSQIEIQTLAASHRELGAAITGFARVLEEAGLVEFYRQLILGVSGAIKAVTGFLGISKQLGEALREKYSIEISSEEAESGLKRALTQADAFNNALIEGFSTAIDGAVLLRNTLLVLFVRVLLPKVAEATKAFTAMVTGSVTKMQELIGVEQGRIKIVGEVTNQYNSQAEAIARTATEAERLALAQSQMAAGLAPATAAAAGQVGAVGVDTGGLVIGVDKLSGAMEGLTKNSLLALRAFQTEKIAREGSVGTIAGASAAVGRGFTTLGRNAAQFARGFRHPIANLQKFAIAIGQLAGVQGTTEAFNKLSKSTGFQIAATTALLQGISAVGAGLDKMAEDLEDGGDTLAYHTARAGSAIAQTAGPFFAFGKEVGLVATTITSFGTIIGSVIEKINALGDVAEAEASFTKVRLNAEQLLIAAQKDELIARGLVTKGYAEFRDIISETGKVLGRELVIDFERIPAQVDVELIRGAALGELGAEMDDIVEAAGQLKTEWALAQEEITKAGKLAEEFRRTTTKIAKEKIRLSLDIAKEDLENAAGAFEDFAIRIDDLATQDIKFQFNVDTEGAQRGSAVLFQLNKALGEAEAGTLTLDEAMSEWSQSFAITNPEIERSAAKLQEMENRAKDLRARIKEFIQTTREYDPSTLDIRVTGALEFGKAFKEIRESAIAFREQGIEPSETQIGHMVERLKEAARLSGTELPEGAAKHVREIVRSGKAIEYTSDRWEIIDKLGLGHLENLKQMVKTLEETVNINEELSVAYKAHEEREKKITEAAIKNVIQLRQQVKLAEERNKSIRRQIDLQSQSRQESLDATQAIERQRIVTALIGVQESNITRARREAAAAIAENERGLQRAVKAAKDLYASELKRAQDFGIKEEDIQPLLQTIELDIEAKIGETAAKNVEALGNLIEDRLKEIETLEKARFDTVKTEIEEVARLEQQRVEAARSVAEGLVEALSAGGLTDTEINKIINTGSLRAQLSQVDASIKRSLDLRSRIELAASLESIDIEARKQAQILQYQQQRAQNEGDITQAALAASRLRLVSDRRLQDRAIAISDAMRTSVVNNFELMAEGTRNATEKLREIAEVEKEIARLRAQVDFTPPEDLATQAARKGALEGRREELTARAEELKSFSDHNRAIREQARALEDARDRSREYYVSLQRQLGLTTELSNAFGQVAIAGETAANVLFETEDSILRIRTENAQAAFQVYQDQLNRLRSLGEQLYTASPSQVLRLAQANAVLENSTQDMASTLATMPLFLRDAAAQIIRLRFGEAGEGLVAEAGLARLGIPGEKLEELQQKVLQEANAIAQDQVRQVEEQQRTADGVDAGVALLERQIAQTERDIKASEDAAQRIEEMRDALTAEDDTPKQQLKEAIERRKLLRGQLAYQQRQLQDNLSQFGVVGPSLQSLDANNKEQINLLKSSDDHLKVLRNSMGEVAASLVGVAEAGLRDINVQLDEAGAPALGTENLGQEIFNNSQAISELTTGIRDIGTEIVSLQASQQEELVRSSADGFKSAYDEVMREPQEAVKTATESSAQALESIKTTSDLMSDVLNETNINSEALKQQMTATRETVDMLGGGTNLQAVVTAINSLESAVNALEVKIDVNVTRVVNQYGGGVGTAATGLSTPEMQHVIAAARQEKSKKPIDSNLIVANSSELIMTPEQAAKIFSQVNMTDRRGNLKGAPMLVERSGKGATQAVQMEGAENVASLLRRVDALLEQQNGLMEMAKDKKLFNQEQNIKIDVAGKREITLKGVAELSRAVAEVCRKQMSQMATKAEQRATEAILKDLIRRIRDAGVDGVYGV